LLVPIPGAWAGLGAPRRWPHTRSDFFAARSLEEGDPLEDEDWKMKMFAGVSIRQSQGDSEKREERFGSSRERSSAIVLLGLLVRHVFLFRLCRIIVLLRHALRAFLVLLSLLLLTVICLFVLVVSHDSLLQMSFRSCAPRGCVKRPSTECAQRTVAQQRTCHCGHGGVMPFALEEGVQTALAAQLAQANCPYSQCQRWARDESFEEPVMVF
jgi:hypothetical protein